MLWKGNNSQSLLLFFDSFGIYCLLLKFGLASKLLLLLVMLIWKKQCMDSIHCFLADSRATEDTGPDSHSTCSSFIPTSTVAFKSRFFLMTNVLHTTEMALTRKRWEHMLGKDATPGMLRAALPQSPLG